MFPKDFENLEEFLGNFPFPVFGGEQVPWEFKTKTNRSIEININYHVEIKTVSDEGIPMVEYQ